MLGTLPNSLEINGVDYPIDTDFRNIFPIFAAFGDATLSDREKVYVCLNRLFVDLDSIPPDDFTAAYQEAIKFLEAGRHDEKPGPKIVNWEKDEQLIFPAISRVAGVPDVRDLPYMHWWTFLGHFMNIDSESLCGCVLRIRQKKAKHKKLEKYEEEFYKANLELCRTDMAEQRKTPEDSLAAMFNDILKEGGGG